MCIRDSFNSSVPLRAHRATPGAEQDELIIEGSDALTVPSRILGFRGGPATGMLLVSLGR